MGQLEFGNLVIKTKNSNKTLSFPKNVLILKKIIIMKQQIFLCTLIGFLFIALSSCNSGNNKVNDNSQNENVSTNDNQDYDADRLVITDKIMYDVQIVNEIIGDRSKNSPDWFWENLPTPDSDNFIKQLLIDAACGKLPTYYYDMTGDYESFDRIPDSEVPAFMEDCLTYEFEAVDTTVLRYKTEKIKLNLDYTSVKKLRFLEEWYVSDGEFKKRVIAVAPYFTIEHDLIEPVQAVFFWIMVDENRINN